MLNEALWLEVPSQMADLINHGAFFYDKICFFLIKKISFSRRVMAKQNKQIRNVWASPNQEV